MKHPSSFPCARSCGESEGFTLVEMLGVITIIGILTALTLLGLRGNDAATSRKAAVGNLMGVLDQARMIAISDGRPAYVAFVSTPKGQGQPNAGALPAEMWGRAYALFEDKVITDTTVSTAFYPAQRSAWMYLPTGVAFKADDTDGSPDSVTAHSLDANSDPMLFQVQSRTGTAGGAVMKLPYVRFDATGQVVDHNGDLVNSSSLYFLRLLLFTGTATNAGAEVVTNPTAGAGGKKYALDEITLRATTGRAQYTLDPVNNFAVTTAQ